MKTPIRIIIFTLAVVVLSWVLVGAAQANSTEQIMYEVLREFDSPLAEEAYTLVAFRRAQGPEFSMIDFLSLVYAESSLGKDSSVRRHHNIGSIKGGPVGSVWRDLRTGTFGSGYNEYATFRDGQRAALRLVMERYGGSVLSGSGLHRWYGYGVSGWSSYSRNVYAARRLLIESGRRHGLAEVHLR